jgi:hypothetical protein
MKAFLVLFIAALVLATSCNQEAPDPKDAAREEFEAMFHRGVIETEDGLRVYKSTCMPIRPMPDRFLLSLSRAAEETVDSMAVGWEIFCLGFAVEGDSTVAIQIPGRERLFECEIQEGFFVILHKGTWSEGTIQCHIAQGD